MSGVYRYCHLTTTTSVACWQNKRPFNSRRLTRGLWETTQRRCGWHLERETLKKRETHRRRQIERVKIRIRASYFIAWILSAEKTSNTARKKINVKIFEFPRTTAEWHIKSTFQLPSSTYKQIESSISNWLGIRWRFRMFVMNLFGLLIKIRQRVVFSTFGRVS